MASIYHRAVLTAALLLLPASALAQAAKPATAKGVWEPVSYPEDIKLTDVAFVTPDIGWVSGAKGTILHTRDGGKTWNPQLGGDPEAADPEVSMLRFFDERHGWAIKGEKLLATTDGENWEEIAPVLQRMVDFVFVSPTEGIAAAGTSIYAVSPHNIFRTHDGGRTWEPGAECLAKAVVDGLTKQIKCHFIRLHFPTPSVGYATALDICSGMGCGPPPIMAKTEDGGETWQFFVGPGDVKVASMRDVFFTGEQTGFVTTSENKLYATADGGNTWKGVVATPGDWLRFADPETGWSFAGGHLAFSTNGGGRWSSRPHRFPASVRGLSFPRRDRAYVVGDHGMIMRYRVLGAAEKAASGGVAAPAMLPYATPLEGQAAEVSELLESVQPVETGSVAPGPAIAPPKLKKIDLLLTALGTSVPSFLDQFTNLNLLAARLRSAGELPSRLAELRSALSAVKKASDRAAADAALGQAFAAAQQLHTAASVATQKQLPATSAPSGSPSAGPAEQPKDESAEETEE